ncbi:TPA: G5 domain-containing protein [Streptococcus suis]
MFLNKKQIFSIRKTSLGVGSILLGLAVFTPTVVANEVAAQDIVASETSLVTSTETTTEPTVETTPIPATTEYLADESLEYGKTEVVTPAVDGVTETVTNYKVVEKPVEMVEQSAKDIMASTDYKYGSTDFYHIDDTQEKPSDKIVIDRIFSDVKPLTAEEVKNNQSIRDIVTGVESLDASNINENPAAEAQGLLKLTSVDGAKPDMYLTTESIDPTNPSFQAILKEYSFIGTTQENRSSTPWTGDLLDANNSQLRKAVYIELAKKSSEVLANLAGFRYINALVGEAEDEATAVKGYFTSKLPISEQLYADAKANYERILLAIKEGGMIEWASQITVDEYGKPVKIMQENPVIQGGKDAFETITKRYNDAKGNVQNPISFEDTSLSTEAQAALVEKISQLPEAVRGNLLKLVVTDKVLELGASTRGLTYGNSNEIQLRHFTEREFFVPTSQGKKDIKLSTIQPDDLFDNFLHELGHAIDNMSGKVVYDYYAYQPEDGQVKSDLRKNGQPTSKLRSLGRLSYSNDFLKVFEEFFVNKEDVWEYIRWTPSEAWVDSLGEYINHKVFGVPFTRYKKIDGMVYSFNPSLAGQNAEYDAMKETVYDIGYSPVEASEFYWESIYKKLFEPEVINETVVDSVTTKTTPAQNGKVLVGTKPQVTIEVISYKTVEETDDSQPIGYRAVKQPGQNGQLETKVTYTVDNQTGQVTAETSKTVLQNALDEVILVGTKVVSEEVSSKPEVSVLVTEEIVAYGTREEADPSQPVGTRTVRQAGENGLVQVTTTTTKDPKTGQVTTTVEKVVLKAVLDEVILVGTKVISEEVSTKPEVTVIVTEEIVAYGTREETDPTQPVGTRTVKQAGENGLVQVTTTTTKDPKTGQVTTTVEKVVLKAVVDEVILVGTKVISKEVSSKPEVSVLVTEELVAYGTREETDPTQPVGTRTVKQAGENGLVQVTTTTTKDPKTGQVTTTVEKVVLKAVIDEIVVVGSKVKENEHKNPSQPINNNEVSQPEVKEEVAQKPLVANKIDKKKETSVARTNETVSQSTKTSTLPATGEKEEGLIRLLGMTTLATGLALAAHHRRKERMA